MTVQREHEQETRTKNDRTIHVTVKGKEEMCSIIQTEYIYVQQDHHKSPVTRTIFVSWKEARKLTSTLLCQCGYSWCI